MLQSIAFMEQENCDFSSLTADPNGYARKDVFSNGMARLSKRKELCQSYECPLTN